MLFPNSHPFLPSMFSSLLLFHHYYAWRWGDKTTKQNHQQINPQLNPPLTSLPHHTKPPIDPFALPLQPYLIASVEPAPSITTGTTALCEPPCNHYCISTSSVPATTSHCTCHHTTTTLLNRAPSATLVSTLSREPMSCLRLHPAKTTMP